MTGTTDENILKQYYLDAYGRIRAFSDCLLTVSPLLNQQGPFDSDWPTFMRPPQYGTLRHEWHRYEMWGFEVRDTILYFLIFMHPYAGLDSRSTD